MLRNFPQPWCGISAFHRVRISAEFAGYPSDALNAATLSASFARTTRIAASSSHPITASSFFCLFQALLEISLKPRRSDDQEQPCSNKDRADEPGDEHTARRETFGSDSGCRRGHDAKVHHAKDQEDDR